MRMVYNFVEIVAVIHLYLLYSTVCLLAV